MTIGELTQEVVFIEDDRARGSSSKAIKPWESYTTVATVWGKLTSFREGSERFLIADWAQSRNVYWLTVYTRSDIRTSMRAQISGRTFEIATINYSPPDIFMQLQLVEIQ